MRDLCCAVPCWGQCTHQSLVTPSAAPGTLGVCATAVCCGPGHPLDSCFGRDLTQTHTSSFTHPFLQQVLGGRPVLRHLSFHPAHLCPLHLSVPEVHRVPHSLRVIVRLPSPGVRERQVLSLLPLERDGVHSTALSTEAVHIFPP